MEKQLTSLAQDRGATFHVPGDSRRIPLDEVLTVFELHPTTHPASWRIDRTVERGWTNPVAG